MSNYWKYLQQYNSFMDISRKETSQYFVFLWQVEREIFSICHILTFVPSTIMDVEHKKWHWCMVDTWNIAHQITSSLSKINVSLFVSLIFFRDRYYSECEDKLYFIALGISYLYIKISEKKLNIFQHGLRGE